MKKNVRWMAFALAALVFSAQAAGCSKSGYEKYDNAVSLDGLNQVTSEPQAEETQSVIDWLQENIENIRQSLLNGEYARVISELLERWDELMNHEYYNALLYIAYMGNGETEHASALLENEHLNMDSFVDAVEETAEELKANPDIQKIANDLIELLNGPEETTRPHEHHEKPNETVPEESTCPPPPRVERPEREDEPELTIPEVNKPAPTQPTEEYAPLPPAEQGQGSDAPDSAGDIDPVEP